MPPDWKEGFKSEKGVPTPCREALQVFKIKNPISLLSFIDLGLRTGKYSINSTVSHTNIKFFPLSLRHRIRLRFLGRNVFW